jgi:hypothetical protein
MKSLCTASLQSLYFCIFFSISQMQNILSVIILLVKTHNDDSQYFRLCKGSTLKERGSIKFYSKLTAVISHNNYCSKFYWYKIRHLPPIRQIFRIPNGITSLWTTDFLCGPVVRAHGYRSKDSDSIPGATRFLRSSGSGTKATQISEENGGTTSKKR